MTFKRVCVICGKEFETDYPNQKACSEECKNKRLRSYSLKMYYKNRKLKPATKKCVICGKTFQATHGNQKICSPKCARENANIKMTVYLAKKNKMRTSQYLERWRTKKLMKKLDESSKCKTLKCPECGETFYGDSKFCSSDCELKYLARIGYSEKTFEWLKGITLRKWKKLSHRRS